MPMMVTSLPQAARDKGSHQSICQNHIPLYNDNKHVRYDTIYLHHYNYSMTKCCLEEIHLAICQENFKNVWKLSGNKLTS